MTTKHTPGPWEIERYSDGLIQIVGDLKVISDDEEHFTTVVEQISATNEEANARLIAAAPDLLEALKDLADDISDRFDMDSPSTNPGIKHCIAAARYAIRKATGEEA